MHQLSQLGTHLEEVDGSPGVEGRLLVDGSKDSRLLGLGGVKSGSEVQLQSLGDLVLQLDLGSEEVGGGPGLDCQLFLEIVIKGEDVPG
jgi:hypothetical protein